MITWFSRKAESALRPGSHGFTALLVGGASILAFGAGYLLQMGEGGLREILPRLGVLALHACLGFLLVGLLLSMAELRRRLSAFRRADFLGMMLLLVAALAVSHEAVPRTNRILYDEHIYQGIAQAIRLEGAAKLCFECTVGDERFDIHVYQYNKQPNGFPYFLSLAYRLMGISENTAHRANQGALALGILCVGAIAWILGRSRVAAFGAAIAFAFTPMVLWWSNTSSADLSSASFSALAFLLILNFSRAPGAASGMMAVGASVWACHFRPESVLILLAGGLAYLQSRGRDGVSERTHAPEVRRLFFAALAFGILAIPLLAHMHLFRNNSWGTTGSKFSMGVFWANLKVNGLFYLNDARFPALFTAAAFLGLRGTFRERNRIPVALWFLCFWGIFLFFYAGSYEYGADVRYSVLSAPPLAILAGLGLDDFVAWTLARAGGLKVTKLRVKVALGVLALTAAVYWLKFVPVITLVGEEGSQARMDVVFARSFATLLPPDSLVLAHNPTLWNMLGKSSAQPLVAANDRRRLERELMPRFGGGTYFHYGYWCNTDSGGHHELCESIIKDYPAKPVAESRYRNYRYGLYRIAARPPAPPAAIPEKKSGRK